MASSSSPNTSADSQVGSSPKANSGSNLLSLGSSSKGSSRSLRSKVDNSKLPELTDELYWDWMAEIASGMAFMHSKRVVHRDLVRACVPISSPGALSL